MSNPILDIFTGVPDEGFSSANLYEKSWVLYFSIFSSDGSDILRSTTV